jgi:predicted ribosome quality control (RQC) complex YloA/Tae2 family protein
MASARLQAMDLTSLRAVLSELRPWVEPSRFEKAQQVDPHTVQLGLRTLEGHLWLELSWQAEAPRFLAIERPPRQGEGSTLAKQLQHGLSALALVQLEEPQWERVVSMGFAARPGATIQRWLVLELMGRHSNLFLLDAQRRVVAAARQVRQQQSRLRPIGTGDPYSPPPALSGNPPSSAESFSHWKQQLTLLPLPLLKAMQNAYQGISPALAHQLAGDEPNQSSELLATPVQGLNTEQWQMLWQRWQFWLTALEERRFRFSPGRSCAYRCWQEPNNSPDSGSDQPRAALALNQALAHYHRDHLLKRQLQLKQHSLRQKLEQRLRRECEQMQQQQELLLQVDSSEELQQQADALLCLTKPSREQVGEAQALYKRARKLRRSVQAITPRLQQHQQRIDQLEASLIYLEQGPENDLVAALNHLQGLEDDSSTLLETKAESSRKRSRSTDVPQPLELSAPSGMKLQIGRNHRQNEWISFRQSRRGDLWFHAQECPGSHVVLKGSEGVVGDGDLQTAAALAAHFSRARGNNRVAVVMVPCDELQRIPGTVAGTVRHRGGEVLWAEPSRAVALLTSLKREPEP